MYCCISGNPMMLLLKWVSQLLHLLLVLRSFVLLFKIYYPLQFFSMQTLQPAILKSDTDTDTEEKG